MVNKSTGVAVIGIVIVAVILYMLVQNLEETPTDLSINVSMGSEDEVITGDTTEQDSMVVDESENFGNGDVMGKTDGDSAMEVDPMISSRYLSYTPELFESLSNSKRVLFFYASWCPMCRPTDAEFTLEQDNIPLDVALFRTDYDHETELKAQYGVTYQHTFVYVDSNGKAISTWNGGGLDELIDRTQN